MFKNNNVYYYKIMIWVENVSDLNVNAYRDNIVHCLIEQ